MSDPTRFTDVEITGDLTVGGNISGGGGGGSGGGGVLVVNEDSDTGTLDKTWQEIADAGLAVVKAVAFDGWAAFLVSHVGEDVDYYYVQVEAPYGPDVWSCNTAGGYPARTDG